MSLSKNLCLRSDSQNNHALNERKEDNYRRDSFEDRFCDDLCEDILQYLPLKDKLRINCVSKQFQRTVFKREYELYIPMSSREERKIFMNNKYFGSRKVYKIYNIEDQSLHSFKAVLKKCPNITSIELDGENQSGVTFNLEKFNRVFQLIIENCNNLNRKHLFTGKAVC